MCYRKGEVVHGVQSIIDKAMKKFSLILGMALSLSPTAMAGNEISAAEVIGRLAAEKSTGSASVADRAPVLSALSLLPADVEAYVSLVNFSQTVREVMALSPDASFDDDDIQQAILCGIRDITIATGKGTTAWMKPFTKIVSDAILTASPSPYALDEEFHVNWKEIGAQLPAPGEGFNMVIGVTISDELMALWKDNEKQMKHMLGMMPPEASGVSGWSGDIAGLPFWGVKINIAEALNEAVASMSAEDAAEFKKVWQGRNLYAALATTGNRVILVLSEDPTRQSLLAKSPSASVLSTKDMDLLDPRLKNDIRFVYHVNADALSLGKEMKGQYFDIMNKAIGSELAVAPSAVDKLLWKWVSIMTSQPVSTVSNEPLNMVAWKDNGVRISFSKGVTSADGANAPLTLLPLASADSNVFFYAEGALSPQGKKLLSEATEGILSELPDMLQKPEFFKELLNLSEKEAQEGAAFGKTHQGELNTLCGDMQTFLSNMENRRAMITDVNSSESQWVVFSDCADRTKAEAEWKKISTTLDKLGVKADGAISFAGKAMAVGDSDIQNTKNVEVFSAGKAPLKGSACYFRPEQLKNRSLFADDDCIECVQWLGNVLDGIYMYTSNDGKTVRGEVYVKAK